MSRIHLGPRSTRSALRAAALLVVPALACAVAPAGNAGTAGSTDPPGQPVLAGRAVLPAMTFADGPPAGAAVPSANGVTFPVPSQPVEGFSAIVSGRRPGEYLAMEDNGFGGKSNSRDFLLRAYYLRPDFKTATGGSGHVDVDGWISFRDPDHKIGFPIVNEDTTSRLLTGGDLDPESLQRGRHGTLWMGEEFGPWLLHFDGGGRLLHAPYPVPTPPPGTGVLKSPNNPFLDGAAATQPNSRGFEGMAISPDRKYLYAALEGATVADPDQSRRYVYEFSTVRHAFTGRVLQYETDAPGHLVADMWAIDAHRLVVIERDLGSGLNAVYRKLYLVDLRRTDADGRLVKTELVDLTQIPDPNLVSLPALHEGDVGLGDPFRVTCESVEAVHLVRGDRLLVGCDNNFPNTARNPNLPDDNEFILVDVPGLRSTH